VTDPRELMTLVRSRIGIEFDGEAHLSDVEAEQIASALEALVVERDEATETLSRVEYSDGDAEHWRSLCEHAEARALAAEAQRDKLLALVEQAFRDGLTYASNVVITDPDEAWRTSRARSALADMGKPE